MIPGKTFGRWELRSLSVWPILPGMARVLIVDDDEITRLILGQILQDGGHEVGYAGDGDAALAAFRTGDFDLVITDLAMPARNGLRLIQDLRGLDRYFPVVAMSGANADQLQMAEDFGAKAVLYKPLSADKVLAVVDELSGGKSPDVWAQSFGLRSHGF